MRRRLRRPGARPLRCVPGIHFEDHPEMQGYELPDWSHLTTADAERFTATLATIVRRDFWKAAKAH